jgi:hypothetical protein
LHISWIASSATIVRAFADVFEKKSLCTSRLLIGRVGRSHAVALLNDIHMVAILTSNDSGDSRHVVRSAFSNQQSKKHAMVRLFMEYRGGLDQGIGRFSLSSGRKFRAEKSM